MVVFGQSVCILAKVVGFVKSGWVREKWLYPGKVFVFGQKRLYSGKVVVIMQT